MPAEIEMAASPGAVAEGLATISSAGAVLDTWFPRPRLTDQPQNAGTERLTKEAAEAALGEAAECIGAQRIRQVEVVAVRTRIRSLAAAPIDAHDVYLRLHLLSHRIIKPHAADLSGLFGLLSNVAWTTLGPCEIGRVDAVRAHARRSGLPFEVAGLDKFPRMTDYVVPSDIRIADANRVRLGAHLAAGTTVMHEGFCNFNAGTLGPCMVEGRISAGVVVGSGSDIGGGASIMGTLSGGGTERISVGERCLIGANAGIGISLGDDCVVEAGCYVTAGARVRLGDGTSVKARELSGRPGLLFRRNSVSGAMEAVPRDKVWGKLNAELHAQA
ncbi:MAG TPA: 2,3,4,5-tetrahydropyridine-2,6-dicarboxylate N-succinyltransferase [Candidatus Sulfotelmatobacter sp.]|nr:2,3,4,5-tetrahydropyridine-2,6-dicarboxylate N-succinyltransferase [Candidatus Sulfotelmatobacter sp.]